MARLWIIGGALLLWVLLYQEFFRYEYTIRDGYAVARFDRLTGKTCGIPECLPPTPTPVPTPTAFDALASYRRHAARFDREANQAVSLVKRLQFAHELERSRGAEKFAWTVEWADQVAGTLFSLHDPSEKHALKLDKRYIDSLDNPRYRIKLVCFCNDEGAGYRWEVNLNTNQVVYVNDNPRLEKKYGLVDASI